MLCISKAHYNGIIITQTLCVFITIIVTTTPLFVFAVDYVDMKEANVRFVLEVFVAKCVHAKSAAIAMLMCCLVLLTPGTFSFDVVRRQKTTIES